jgi:hypothetical protein
MIAETKGVGSLSLATASGGKGRLQQLQFERADGRLE